MSAPIKSNHVCFKADKRSVSPHRFPLLRSGSLSSRPKTQSSSRSTTPHSSRPTTPSNSNGQRRVRSLCSPFFYYIKRKMTSLLLCFAKILCLRCATHFSFLPVSIRTSKISIDADTGRKGQQQGC